MNEVAVLYLARLAEGFSAFEQFAISYRAHPAEHPHDLIVIAKGFENPGQFAALNAVFADIPCRIIEMPDDAGLDIHAYRRAALVIQNDIVCCLNTFSDIKSTGWLRKLVAGLGSPGVGIVGATGSFESLLSSWRIMHRISWYCHADMALDTTLVENFSWIFQAWVPASVAALTSRRLRLRRRIGDLLRRRPRVERLAPMYPDAWTATQHTGGGLAFLRDYPPFPNPHIRSNAFMVRRSDLLNYRWIATRDKHACMRFESGRDSITNFIRRSGRRALIVGADGRGYELHDWPVTGCFRSSDQVNLLIADNQTQMFASLPARAKLHLQQMTWGGYLPGVDTDLKLLDVPFGGRHDLDAVNMDLAHDKSSPRLFSVVIPCHDRVDLLLDAIKTIRRQGWSGWEICIFDNASRSPVSAAIEPLDDPRIRCERSETFLHVTDSWNRAMDMARGDYVTLIGDDDGLLPDFFARLNAIVDRFGSPELIFSSLYQFIHPGVDRSNPQGYVRTMPSASFFDGEPLPFLLDRKTAKEAVDSSLAVRRSFLFTIPAFTCSRGLLDRLRRNGRIFHSPFPDYYFANIALDTSRKTVCEPKALAFQGVSKVSFGFSLFSQKPDDGFKALGEIAAGAITQRHHAEILPGPRYQSEYIITMAHVAEAIGDSTRTANFGRYRKLQILEQIRTSVRIYRSSLWPRLSTGEKFWAVRVAILRYVSARFKLLQNAYQDVERDVSAYDFRPSQVMLVAGAYVRGSDVYDAAARGDLVRL